MFYESAMLASLLLLILQRMQKGLTLLGWRNKANFNLLHLSSEKLDQDTPMDFRKF